MKRTTISSIPIFFAAVTLLPTALSESCDIYNDCSSCTSNGCSWALVYNCSWMCLYGPDIKHIEEKDGQPIDANPLKSEYWRHEIKYSDKCIEEEDSWSCTELEDGIKDKSFEHENTYKCDGCWIHEKRLGITNSMFSHNVFTPVDGKQYISTGTGNEVGGLDYRLVNTFNLNPNATHLSLYYRTIFKGQGDIMDIFTSFTIMLDGNITFRLDRYNYKHYWTHNNWNILEISLKDNINFTSKKHDVIISFTEKLTQEDVRTDARDFICIDYLQIIKKNSNTTH